MEIEAKEKKKKTEKNGKKVWSRYFISLNKYVQFVHC